MTRIISIVGGMQPTAPTIGTATAGDTTASVAFTASSYIGKGTITYTATSSPGGLTATGASSPLTVTGLSNGTAYTFTVVGNTNYGVASVASAASNSITPVPGTSYVSIASYVLSGGAGTITFNSIPQTYSHLQIRAYGRNSNNSNNLRMEYNGDSTNGNYYARATFAGGSASGWTQNYPWVTYWLTSGAPGNYMANVVIDILDYKNTNKAKIAQSMGGFATNADGYAWYQTHTWNNTNAISSIAFSAEVGANLEQYTRISLYGIA